MGILRSDVMKCGTLVLPPESARTYMDVIGREVHMEIEDMNTVSMARPYRKNLQRLDEIDRLLRFLFEEVGRIDSGDNTMITGRVDSFLENDSTMRLERVEEDVQAKYRSFLTFQQNSDQILRDRCFAQEELCVLRQAAHALASSHVADTDAEDEPMLGAAVMTEDGMRFSNIAGVVPQTEQDRMARTLFRASRGNTFVHFEPIAEPLFEFKTRSFVAKSVFVVYFQGAADGRMQNKVSRVCSALGATLYAWPSNSRAARERLPALEAAVSEQSQALDAYNTFLATEVAQLLLPPRDDGNSLMEEWRMYVAKERLVCSTLNRFEGELTLRATCWYPAAEEALIQELLVRHAAAGQVAALLLQGGSGGTPPTRIRSTEFTAPFQELVDTLGVPNYGEVNPMIFTCISFPFLFGVMFGDIGHGAVLLVVGLYFCWMAPEWRDDKSKKMFLYMRYMLVLMGFFAMYAGFMYNDFLSLGFTLFPSRWEMVHDSANGVHVGAPTHNVANPSVGPGPYPFGLDPAWHGASNELLFVNSLKMKVAVLLGVAQMLLGVGMRCINSFHKMSVVDIVCECIPQLVIMICFFGYMDWMIMYKWVTPMDNPPSIINTLIGMGLGAPVKDPLYEGQEHTQSILLILTGLAMPMLLIPKPLALWFLHKRALAARATEAGDDDAHVESGSGSHAVTSSSGGRGGRGGSGGVPVAIKGGKTGEDEAVGEHEEFDLGEAVIHQIIETIEYVLGTISHTASYLRLWALSLAHQQLSLVFFSKIMLGAMALAFPYNGAAIFIAFAVFSAVTFAVLLSMDCLECFLHTLRLHWVEFQGKFFKGEGHRFAPLSLHDSLAVQEVQ